MAQQSPTYDLMLLLSTAAPAEQRAKVLADVQSAISAAGGTVQHSDEWGDRPLSYRIGHQAGAQYHLLQFTGPPSLLEGLSHSLRITDGVMRHRIIKVLPGTPPPRSSPPVVAAAEASAAPAAPTSES